VDAINVAAVSATGGALLGVIGSWLAGRVRTRCAPNEILVVFGVRRKRSDGSEVGY
jgi:hypothetical protein